MISDRTKIESVLERGKEILLARPELADMSLSDIIEELNDGTQEMIRVRWGVAAWVVVKSTSNFELQTIIDQLSDIKSGTLTYEYAGYLLMTEYGINLEELLLHAEKCNKFDNIVPYVIENLKYEMEMYEDNVMPILDMMENHLEHNIYHSFLRNYAKHIEAFIAQGLVVEQLGTVTKQVHYDLMHYLWAGWYACNAEEASKSVDWLLETENIWSKKAAIDCIDISIYYDRTVFQKHFAQIENMISESNEFWIIIIPLFTKYIMTTNESLKNNSDRIGNQVLKYLERIPNESQDAKYSFLESAQYPNGIAESLQTIINDTLSQSFCKDQRILNALDHYLYTQFPEGAWHETLQTMKNVFLANRYFGDYEDFFHAMNLLRTKLKKYSSSITLQAINNILSGDLGQLFFGLGLLVEFGDIQSLFQDKEKNPEIAQVPVLTNPQMIQLMKAIFYYWADSKRVCDMAFQLLNFSNDSNELYTTFCMEEIFKNYPATMYETAKQYDNSGPDLYLHLSKLVIEKYDRQLSDKQRSYQINDLRPSQEHDYIYRKAIIEQNRRINKQAEEESVFRQLFKTRMLKYGVRSAFIVKGRKNEKFYQVHPYARIEHKVELPMQYICDPVEFSLNRQAYIKEVMSHAPDY